MKSSAISSILMILVMVSAFLFGGVGSFYLFLFLDSHLQLGGVGINTILFAFTGATLCAVVVGIVIERCLYRDPFPPEDGSSKEPRS